MRAIVAMDSNRVIGNGIKIPWHIPDDFKWFKKTTMGGHLLMGCTTFNAIGKPLPGRITHVLTRNTDKIMSSRAVPSIYEYVGESWVNNLSPEIDANLWLCGGASVYAQFLPRCSEVYVTHVFGEHEGDIFMPEFEPEFPNQEILMEHKDFLVARHFR